MREMIVFPAASRTNVSVAHPSGSTRCFRRSRILAARSEALPHGRRTAVGGISTYVTAKV